MIELRCRYSNTDGSFAAGIVTISSPASNQSNAQHAEYQCAVQIPQLKAVNIVGETPIDAIENSVIFIRNYASKSTDSGKVFAWI
jgi:hypothetical protein